MHAFTSIVLFLVAVALAGSAQARGGGKRGLAAAVANAALSSAARATARDLARPEKDSQAPTRIPGAGTLERIDDEFVVHRLKARAEPPKGALPSGPSADELERAAVAAWEAQHRNTYAAIQADVDRIWQRALDDYPVLKTPAGSPVLQQIRRRQKELSDTGMYPSVALVEAVADHAADLAPPRLKAPAPAAAPAVAVDDSPRQIGGCRWVNAIAWSCR